MSQSVPRWSKISVASWFVPAGRGQQDQGSDGPPVLGTGGATPCPVSSFGLSWGAGVCPEKPMALVKHKSYEALPRQLKLFRLEKTRQMRDIVILYNFLKGGCRKVRQASSNRTREDGIKLCQGRFRLDIRKNIFTKCWLSTGTHFPGKWRGHYLWKSKQLELVKSQVEKAILDRVLLMWWYWNKTWTWWSVLEFV